MLAWQGTSSYLGLLDGEPVSSAAGTALAGPSCPLGGMGRVLAVHLAGSQSQPPTGLRSTIDKGQLRLGRKAGRIRRWW